MTISGLVPMLSVQDVERAAAFYELLGFAVGNRVPRTGAMNWTWLYAPDAPDWRRGPNLMLTRSDGAIDGSAQATVLYLYASDLVALREKLIDAGQNPGPLRYPDYLPKGEFKLNDPDGYKLMIAQNFEDTP
jgi:catechol 2,3-dioxygenase-like lactoylglutathione lyase family enzyme